MMKIRVDILTNKILSMGEGKYITDGPNVVVMEFPRHEIPNEDKVDFLKFDPISKNIIVNQDAKDADLSAQNDKLARKLQAKNLLASGIPDTQPGQSNAIALILNVLKDNNLI